MEELPGGKWWNKHCHVACFASIWLRWKFTWQRSYVHVIFLIKLLDCMDPSALADLFIYTHPNTQTRKPKPPNCPPIPASRCQQTGKTGDEGRGRRCSPIFWQKEWICAIYNKKRWFWIEKTDNEVNWHGYLLSDVIVLEEAYSFYGLYLWRGSWGNEPQWPGNFPGMREHNPRGRGETRDNMS